MRKYETVVVFDPSLGEAELKEEIKKTQTLLENNGAAEIDVDSWGKKEIAYLVGKTRYGHYVALNYRSASSETVAGVEGILRITDAVLKFQTHRINERKRKFKGNPKKLAAKAAAEEQSDAVEAEY